MAVSTLVWTALPAGIRQDEGGNWKARISVFLAPRLAPDAEATLADFPALVDWPATLASAGPNGISLRVSVSDGKSVIGAQTAMPTTTEPRDSTAWRALLPADTPVRAVPNPGAKQAVAAPVTFPGEQVLTKIRRVYAQTLPSGEQRKQTDALREFARVGGMDDGLLTSDVDTSLSQLAAFLRPSEQQTAPLRADAADEPHDLHRIIAGFGGHPALLRRLGLVLDIELDTQTLALDDAGSDLRIAVAPVGLDTGAITHDCPWTAVEIGAAGSASYQSFCVRQREGSPRGGLHALPQSPDSVAQEKLEHAFGALVQHATTVLVAPRGNDTVKNTPPALLQVGMRMLDDAHAGRVAAAAAEQARIAESLTLPGGLLGAAPGDGTGAAPPPPDTQPLYADQLTRGVRIDVQDADAGPWRSLCGRQLRYTAGDWAWPAGQSARIVDEGTVEPTVYDDANAEEARFRIPPELFTWDGWSLAVPHPDEGLGGTPDPAADDDANALDAVIEVPPRSLQPQRFGRRYRFRARSVDLAGNSLTLAEANAIEPKVPGVPTATAPTRCMRVENAQPPATFPAQPRGWGESGDVIVVRDADEARYQTTSFRLHLLPPPVSVRIAERHGMFDGMTPAASWQLLQDNKGELDRDASGNQRDFIPDATLFTPYLPDPVVRTAVMTLPDGTRIDLPRFDTLPPRAPQHALAVGCALVVEGGYNDLVASVDGRTVRLHVPRGRVTEVRVAAKLDDDTLAAMALASTEWTGGHAQAAVTDAAAQGKLPALAPSRTLRILHATQRPLTAPIFVAPALSPRAPDATEAVLLDPKLLFDGPSSGRVDVYASWQETIDDPDAPAWRLTNNRMLAGGTEIREQQATPPFGPQTDRRPALAHDFGDTRHRLVTYRALATSRFAAFFPPSLTTDAANITRVGPAITLHVPSTAPPEAPEVAYVLPTFRRTEPPTKPRSSAAMQRGFGLRVYLQRGWFSSGEGEQLAVVLAGGGASAAVSEWGTDPTIDTAALPGPLGPDQVVSGTTKLDNWPLPDGNVVLIPHDVTFGEAQGLPFADITFASQATALPMVRLALARYQQHAIDNCHLSPIVHADFVPLAPDRNLTVVQTDDAKWRLAYRGQGYKDASGTVGAVEAVIEYQPILARADDAAWLPGGDTVTLDGELHKEDYSVTWSGDVAQAPGSYTGPRWRRRLVLREYAPGDARRLLGVQTVAL